MEHNILIPLLLTLGAGLATTNCSKNPQTLFVMKGYRLLCVTE